MYACILLRSPLCVQNGQTALYVASYKGHDKIVELLLRREADVNHQIKVKLLCVLLSFILNILYYEF